MSSMIHHNRQSGFSAIEVLSVVIIIFVIGAVGVLLATRSNKKNAQKTDTTNQQSSTVTAPTAKDYTTYTNAVLGFSLAYPKDWGTVTVDNATAAPATGSTPDLRNAKKYPFYFGSLNFTITPKASFQLTGQKNGATYVPVLKNSYNYYVWKVVSVNAADRTDKIGDIYSAPVVTSTAGVQLYDFNWNDGNNNIKRWAFETKAGFVSLSLPAFGYQDKQPSAADAAVQQSIADTISKSIQLIY